MVWEALIGPVQRELDDMVRAREWSWHRSSSKTHVITPPCQRSWKVTLDWPVTIAQRVRESQNLRVTIRIGIVDWLLQSWWWTLVIIDAWTWKKKNGGSSESWQLRYLKVKNSLSQEDGKDLLIVLNLKMTWGAARITNYIRVNKMLEEEAVSVFRRGGGFTYQIVWQAVSSLTVIATDTSLSELWAEASLLVEDTLWSHCWMVGE